jgi:hypothetical protein
MSCHLGSSASQSGACTTTGLGPAIRRGADQRAVASVKALAATLGLPSASQVFRREEMIGERVARALVGTTPSPSRVQMRLTLAAIKVNRGHMILVICGPE